MVQMFFDAKSSIKFQQNSELSGHGCYTAVGWLFTSACVYSCKKELGNV